MSATAPSTQEGVGEDEAAVAAHAPGVAAGAAAHVLAHGSAAEDQRLDGEEGGVARHGDLGAAVEPGPVEQDGRLRQPGEVRGLADIEADPDGGLAVEGAVDLLGGGGGDGGAAPGGEATSTLMRSPPVRPPAVLRSTASGASPPAGLGKRTRPAPDWRRPASAVRPSAPRTKPRRTEPSVRGSQDGVRPLASIVQAPIS